MSDEKVTRGCLQCRHLSRVWESLTHGFMECSKLPMDNLKSFPFKNTKCRGWEPIVTWTASKGSRSTATTPEFSGSLIQDEPNK